MGILDLQILAFVFPGQGSQCVGMGKDLAENYPVAADIFKRADDVLGFSISDICFNGPEEVLKQTINTQPALFVTSVAAFEVVKERGLRPSFAAGHSIGEYAALYAAGAFSFETGCKLVKTRAELMQKAAESNPGTMAAVLGLSSEQVMEVVAKASDKGIVVAANLNSPIQTVISGDAAGVARASEIASEMGAKRVVTLNVSGAFHSPLMKSAAESLAKILAESEISNPHIPIVANFTADFEKTADQVRESLANQIVGSVRWTQTIQLLAESANAFIELGAGNVLAGLNKRIAPDIETFSVSDKASVEAIV